MSEGSPVSGKEKDMIVTRKGAQAATPGPAANFTGTVRVEPHYPVQAPSRVSAASVTFAPGARSAWHTHPAGQTLVVTSGTGWVQQEGGEKRVIRAGDVVWTPPGVKHWHGATASEGMTHIAIQETVDGKAVEWMEKVTDAQYQSPTEDEAAAVAPSNGRKAFGDIAPALAGYTDDVLFGDVWKRAGLSPRDRSLVTVSALVAGYRTNELPFHVKRALDNGVTRDEIIEVITHLAFYSGWPTASSALPIARRVFQGE
jgi:4-carboxymuconolactone decarboxylase